jgi:predicted DNA-binding transcriptional regulator AlpA
VSLASPIAAAPATQGHRLIDANVVSQECGWSRHNTIRAADQGLMPASVKIGRLRHWDEAEIDAWIASGCRPVRDHPTTSSG